MHVCTWTAFSIRIAMWESDIFECSDEEPPSKKRDTRSKSPVKTGCSQQRRMLKKAEKQLIVSKIKRLTPENIAKVSLKEVKKQAPECNTQLQEFCTAVCLRDLLFFVEHLQESFVIFIRSVRL